MTEAAFTCEVSCQLCGWKTGATILTDEDNLFSNILTLVGQSTPQHTKRGSSGKLLLVWEPAEKAAI